MLLCYRKDHDSRYLITSDLSLRTSDIKVSRVAETNVWQGKFSILLYRYR